MAKEPPRPRTVTPQQARQQLGRIRSGDLEHGARVTVTTSRERPGAKGTATQVMRTKDRAMNAQAAKADREYLRQAFGVKVNSDRAKERERGR